MTAMLTEKRVLEIWQDSLQSRTDLRTEDNQLVRVVYPGRCNDDRGADFKDAVIATGRGRLTGDIEIHVKASNWWAHGHHRDPAYNRVILHVVYRNDSGRTAVLQNGEHAPTLALDDYIKSNNYHALPSAMPCRLAFYRRNTGRIAAMLEEAGEQRFLAKADIFQGLPSAEEAGQALYRGIMTALGYSKNKGPMAELADRLPLKKLEQAASGEITDSEYLCRCQALLTGTAGLLPSQRGMEQITAGWEEKLEKYWAASGERAQMSPADWRFFKVRPGNQPVRRLAAMSYLLLRYKEKGLLAGLEEKLAGTTDGNNSGLLEQALAVAPEGYWGCYLDFGALARGVVPALLGSGRAADIIINVLLPFACALGPAQQGEKVMAIYRDYSAAAENSLVRHMRGQLGLSKPFIATARRQQGLIHIYKTRCVQGRCGECPMGNI